MQDRPDAGNLLEAIQDFLMKEVMPAVKSNDLLSYKTLVSWNMLGVISREIKLGEVYLNEELKRLKEYLTSDVIIKPEDDYYSKMEVCKELNSRLVEKIREKKLTNKDKEVWNLVKQGLKEKLEISNPRFQSGE
ncbi:MAG: hypothetical protein KDK36_06215 [Leptospiraceae bacterium]|nr:hypothetical protein [Leptospiraceae bacterium]